MLLINQLATQIRILEMWKVKNVKDYSIKIRTKINSRDKKRPSGKNEGDGELKESQTIVYSEG